MRLCMRLGGVLVCVALSILSRMDEAQGLATTTIAKCDAFRWRASFSRDPGRLTPHLLLERAAGTLDSSEQLAPFITNYL